MHLHRDACIVTPAAPRTKALGWLMLLPVLALCVVVVAAPLANLLVQSLSSADGHAGFTLGNYTRFFTDPFFLSVLGRTFRIAALVVVLCLIIGWPVAYFLARSSGRARVFLTLIVLAPLLISVVVRTFGWVVVLGRNGVVNNLLVALGVLDEPARLLYNEGAVLLGMVHMLMPLMVLPIAAALDNVDPALARAAQNLGAGFWQVLFRVWLPLSLPGIVAGTIITFSLAASAFVTPVILGGARMKFMSSLIYQYNVTLLDWPFGSALSIILLTLTLALVTAYTRAVERGPARAVFER
jgi:putative spermidine/putrescine transport system permease protein